MIVEPDVTFQPLEPWMQTLLEKVDAALKARYPGDEVHTIWRGADSRDFGHVRMVRRLDPDRSAFWEKAVSRQLVEDETFGLGHYVVHSFDRSVQRLLDADGLEHSG